MSTPPTVSVKPTKQPLITPEADRALFRILFIYGGAFVVLFLLMPWLGIWANIKGSPLFPTHKFIDLISTLIMLTPFFIGINAMNVARLKFGRLYAEQRNWRAVYGAVEPFSQLGQRFLDGSGEAHYLLSQAYDNLGERAKAESTRKFVLKYRSSSIWAQKLRDFEAARAPKKISEIRARREETGRKLTKSKRRF